MPVDERGQATVWAHFQFAGTGPALEAAGKAYYEYRAALDVCGWSEQFHRLRPLPRLGDRRGRLGPYEETLPLDAGDILGSSI